MSLASPRNGRSGASLPLEGDGSNMGTEWWVGIRIWGRIAEVLPRPARSLNDSKWAVQSPTTAIDEVRKNRNQRLRKSLEQIFFKLANHPTDAPRKKFFNVDQ
jgi:hypothetical protein